MQPEEYAMAVALAEKRGLNVSDVFRLQIREAYEREISSKEAAKSKRKK
jgi:hypothetical protein